MVDGIRYNTSVPLYAEDSYLKAFDAEVVKAGPRFAVLDRTAFYPESGGQPSDTGVLSLGGEDVHVLKVMRRGRDIFHYLDRNVQMGSTVHGVIDWEQRYFNMRRHSAEHLLTGLFETAGSGPKVYSDLKRLEFKPSELDEEMTGVVEARFNEIVDEDVLISIYYADRDELEVGDDERKQAFLEKIPLDVDHLRMVDISGHALTFCFGTHVKSTAEIGHLAGIELKREKRGRRVVYFTLI